MDLQTRLDEKESKAIEIRDSFMQFKREIAKAAENTRTGKAIPRRIIRQFEETEEAKDVTKTYASVLAHLRSFEAAQYQAWGVGVDEVSQSKLKQ